MRLLSRSSRTGRLVLAAVCCALGASLLTGCATMRGSADQDAVPPRAAVASTAGTETASPSGDFYDPDTPALPAETTHSHEELFLAGLSRDAEHDHEGDLSPDEESTPAPHDLLSELEPELTDDVLARERLRVANFEPTFDYPMTTNKKVLGWIDYYARRNPSGFEKGLERSGRYMQMFRQIFAEAGIPRDLVYMAHVESAYKTSAYSRARAKGIFQFISATGRRYGLRIDYWVDERSDPEKSAHAATAYLNDLYDEFGDWYLALAAYNAGEGRLRKAVRRSGSHDFWTISKSTRHLRRETRNYVPAILAATLISKDPTKYGFDVSYDDRIEYESIKVEGAADLRVLAKCAGTDFDTMKLLNPMLRRYQTPPGATTDVRVPVGAAEQTLVALGKVPQNERVLYARHRVRSGDTLSKISRQYGVSVRAIQDSNRMGRSTMIRVGRTLVIPTVATGSYPSASPVAAADVIEGEVVSYRVRRGDTLSRIAKRYGTSSGAIAAASNIGMHSTLSIGQRLKVVPGVRNRHQAARIASGGSSGGSYVAKTTYTVRRGDSLWKIANRHKTTVARLCSLNNISSKSVLRPGTKLVVR